MDLETVDAADLGRSLGGIGTNLLTRDVPALAAALSGILGLPAYRVTADFALVAHAGQLIQIHSDRAFANHPLAIPAGLDTHRGAGVQIYLFGLDPDAVAERARANGDAHGIEVIEPPADKPHGLRETTIRTREGYAFTASRPLARLAARQGDP